MFRKFDSTLLAYNCNIIFRNKIGQISNDIKHYKSIYEIAFFLYKLKIQLQNLFNLIQNQLICRKPVYRTQSFFGKPAGRFVLQEFQFAGNDCAQNAMHGQMEGWVIVIHNAENAFRADFGCKLLADFAFNALLWSRRMIAPLTVTWFICLINILHKIKGFYKKFYTFLLIFQPIFTHFCTNFSLRFTHFCIVFLNIFAYYFSHFSNLTFYIDMI